MWEGDLRILHIQGNDAPYVRHSKIIAFTDSWFVFEFCLVSVMVFETWIMSALYALIGFSGESGMSITVLRLLRLIRLT